MPAVHQRKFLRWVIGRGKNERRIPFEHAWQQYKSWGREKYGEDLAAFVAGYRERFPKRCVTLTAKAFRETLKLAETARQVRVPSGMYYGYVPDERGQRQRVPLSTDKGVAEETLAELVIKAERRRRGHHDSTDDAAEKPLAEHVAAYKLALQQSGRSSSHVADTIRYVKKVAKASRAAFLKDISAERVVQYLHDLRSDGRGPRTVNAYLVAMQAFCRWCVRDGRLRSHPLAHVEKLNEQTDVRLERRTLPAGELAQLLEAARGSDEIFRRLNGVDREMLYALAVGTGLRANELASLATASVDLTADPPFVVVEAAYSKRRRRDEQPLPAWLATKLAGWLADRDEGKLFPGSWPGRAAEMLQKDLAAAKIPYEDGAGRVFDFHSFRHQFITGLAASGVHPKIAQTLARHSSIELTMNRYTHLALADVAGALGQVADPSPESQRQVLRATGTDDGAAPPRCLNGASRPVKKVAQMSRRGKMGKNAEATDDGPEVLAMSDVNEAEGTGLEPATPEGAPEFQSGRTLRIGLDSEGERAQRCLADPDLAAIVDAWPELSPDRRACLLAIVRS